MDKASSENRPLQCIKSSDLAKKIDIAPQKKALRPWEQPGRAAWLCHNLPEDLKPKRKRQEEDEKLVHTLIVKKQKLR